MKRVVLVEDDGLLAAMYAHSFERAGLKVKVLATAEAALDWLKDDRVDLLVLDILLPGKNGLWLLKELKVQQLTLPVIILSNLAEADFAMPVRLRESLGVVGYYVKTNTTPAEVVAAAQEAVVG